VRGSSLPKRAAVSLFVFACGGFAISCSAETEVTADLSGAPAGTFGDADRAATLGAGGALPPGTSPGRAGPSASDETGLRTSGLDAATAPERSATGAVSNAEPSVQVPTGEYCALVSAWQPAWTAFEDAVLALVNEARSQPADCHSEGEFPAAQPLVMDPILRCSARLHSLDMFERDYFDHTDPDGKDPFQRMLAAGFRGNGGGENIAMGQTTPEQVMESWMASDGHCANVMRGTYQLLGVGYHPGAGGRGLGSNYWTQNFGVPLSSPRVAGRGCDRADCR
jgi:uncharacterized protein YkwD